MTRVKTKATTVRTATETENIILPLNRPHTFFNISPCYYHRRVGSVKYKNILTMVYFFPFGTYITIC